MSALYECMECGFVYDPEEGDEEAGVEPGTPFEELPDDWTCPICGASKNAFEPYEESEEFDEEEEDYF
ncbi:MAG: rubredoxin [Candidatus Korarchaeota archaeon]